MKKFFSLILSLSLIISCSPLFASTVLSADYVHAETIVNNAKSLVDKYPYVKGGESPEEGGFDCSGFVWYVFNKMSGIDISLTKAGRSRSGLASAGARIDDISDFLPGDIVQFKTDHVAIYIGDNTIVEAPGEGQRIKYTTLSSNSDIAYAIRLSSVMHAPLMIGYRSRRTFEDFKEYPVDHIYYFDGVKEPVYKDGTTYLTVSNVRAVIHNSDHPTKELDALNETTVTVAKALDSFTVYRLNSNYKMDIIHSEKNVAKGKTYTFKEKGLYELSCNNKVIASVEVVSSDHHSLRNDINPQMVQDNPYNYVPIYKGDEGRVLTPGTVLADPTESEIVVESGAWKLDAYNIGGNNYFKLRDLAFTFTYEGSSRPFEVTWDSEKNAISILSNREYTAVGGECGGYNVKTGKLPDAETMEMFAPKLPRAAFPTTSEIYIDGKKVSLTAYNIDGNNYFKLRDLAKALNFEVSWDPEDNMIYVSTYGSYISE